jgi:ribosomal protein L37AE/L43A
MPDDGLDERVERLEERLSSVERRLDRYREQHALLLTQADIDALEEPTCPECGERALDKRSGLSWAKAACDQCGTEWVLDG